MWSWLLAMERSVSLRKEICMKVRWIVGAVLLSLVCASVAVAAKPISTALPIKGMT
jgi:hypothetical protein